MRKSKSILLIFTCILFMSTSAAYAAVVDKVIAVVNDELITQSELDRILVPVFEQYSTLYAGDELLLRMDEKRREILNYMINDKLILSEARKRNIEIKPEEIEKKLKGLKAKFSSEEAFQQTLINQGVTLAELQKRYADELLKEKFINTEVRAKVIITPTEIKGHYDSNIDRFKIPPQARVSNILIRIKEGKEIAYNKAKEVLERLKKGEAFAGLATAYSEGIGAKEGGDMGYLSKGQLKQEFDDVIFALKKGEFSDIVESSIGYHIFMVLDKKDEVVMSLEDAHDKIRDVLYRQKANKRFQELIEEIKKNAYISIK